MNEAMREFYRTLKKWEPYANVGKLNENRVAQIHMDFVKLYDRFIQELEAQ